MSFETSFAVCSGWYVLWWTWCRAELQQSLYSVQCKTFSLPLSELKGRGERERVREREGKVPSKEREVGGRLGSYSVPNNTTTVTS